MRTAILIFSIFAFGGTQTLAGAWLPASGDTKIIINQIEQKQQKRNVINFRHSEIYRSFLIEHGLSAKMALAAKGGQQSRFEPQSRHNSDETRLGLMLNMPLMATGLLPPFSYDLIKAALPFKSVKREKRATMTLGLHNEHDEYWSAFALADGISVGHFRIMQEVEFDRIRGPRRDWRNWLYRFTLGYRAIELGTEAHKFSDHRGTYQALAHSYIAHWKPRDKSWQLRLKNGLRRAPMVGLAVQKNDYLTLEWELRF